MANSIERNPVFFADTSNIEEIKKLLKRNYKGITTNPTIVATEAGSADPSSYYKQLVESFPNFPISMQLLDQPFSDLITQARKLSSLGNNVVVKIPMFSDGRALELIPYLKREGINVNVTGLMNTVQVLTALMSSDIPPDYVSLFLIELGIMGVIHKVK